MHDFFLTPLENQAAFLYSMYSSSSSSSSIGGLEFRATQVSAHIEKMKPDTAKPPHPCFPPLELPPLATVDRILGSSFLTVYLFLYFLLHHTPHLLAEDSLTLLHPLFTS